MDTILTGPAQLNKKYDVEFEDVLTGKRYMQTLDPAHNIEIVQQSNLPIYSSIHNHPRTSPSPSVNDLRFGTDDLVPHIIVTKDQGAFTWVQSSDNTLPYRSYAEGFLDVENAKVFLHTFFRYYGRNGVDTYWNKNNFDQSMKGRNDVEIQQLASNFFGRMPVGDLQSIKAASLAIRNGDAMGNVDSAFLETVNKRLPGKTSLIEKFNIQE